MVNEVYYWFEELVCRRHWSDQPCLVSVGPGGGELAQGGAP